jgi:hypothetical protein
MNPTIIPLSKTKIGLTIAGSIIFVALGAYFILHPETFASGRHPLRKDIAPFVGVACVLFFGATGIYGLIRLFDKRPGLVIDEDGITDRSSGAAVGRVLWKDIESISVMKVHRTRFLRIMVNNPKQYTKDKRGLRKFTINSNLRMYGTPVSINAVTLQCKFEELERLVREGFEESRRSRQSQ